MANQHNRLFEALYICCSSERSRFHTFRICMFPKVFNLLQISSDPVLMLSKSCCDHYFCIKMLHQPLGMNLLKLLYLWQQISIFQIIIQGNLEYICRSWWQIFSLRPEHYDDSHNKCMANLPRIVVNSLEVVLQLGWMMWLIFYLCQIQSS